MPRPLMLFLFAVATIIALLGFATMPESNLIAQEPVGVSPGYPVCSLDSREVLRFGPSRLVSPQNLEDTFNFIVRDGLGPEGQVLVWQGEGHLWDLGCNPGPGNDGGREGCDDDQLHEVITFTVNGDAIGQFVDHSPDTDNNYFYSFDVDNLVTGNNELGLHHLNEGTGSNSVFYKGVVCAVAAATSTPTSTATPTTDSGGPTATSTATNTPTNTPTSTPTNTPTSTPTNTPTSTPTNTPTDMPTSTSTPTNTPTSTPTLTPTPTNTPDPSGPTGLDPVDQPSEPSLLDQICNTGICQFLPFVTGD